MDEYASLRKIEFELCGGNLPEKYKAFVRRVLNDRNLIPAADVAPVVRCRDCMHLRPEVDAYTQETVGYWCAELDIGSVDVDGFCNRGERKETDHD